MTTLGERGNNQYVQFILLLKVSTNLPFASDTSYLMEMSKQSFSEVENVLSDLEMSAGSIPILEQTPMISDGINTPNTSQYSLNFEKVDVTDVHTVGNTSIQKILLEAGYKSSEIQAITSLKHKENHNDDCLRGRPQTQVFSQGRVFTYEKLEAESSLTNGKHKSKLMPSEESRLCKLEIKAPLTMYHRPTSPPPEILENLRQDGDAFAILKNLRVQNLRNVIIGQLNINSLRNKFDGLAELMKGKLDIVVLTETKVDHTFPEKQFLVTGYKKPFRLDRNINGGGVMIYVREDIPCDILLKHNIPTNLEAIFVEINLRKNKLLLVGTYHSKNAKYGVTDDEFFKNIGLALDFYSTRYDKFLLAGDFNTQEDNEVLEDFLEDYHAKNLVKDPTCYKNPESPSCIDLFITNSYQSF